MSSLTIRKMAPEHLDLALGWAREEGWNPGIEDAQVFRAADPGGFYMGWLGTLPIGCVSVVRYGADFAFLGLYLVRPAFRGKGYGKAIWDAAVAGAANRTIGLDGVVAQQENYRRSGFAPSHRTVRWGGTLRGLVAARSFVRPVTESDFGAIADYDRRHFPAERPAFLRAWLAPSATRQTEGFFEDGRLVGYGSIRRCARGWKIGPLFADNSTVAEALLATLVTPAATDPVTLDIPEPNAAGTSLAKRLGFTPVFETARMYRGTAPTQSLDGVYGVTTLELG